MPTNDTIHYVHTNLYSDKAKEIMDSVFGQLSDGWGENNPRNDRYWRFGRVERAENGELLIAINQIGSKSSYGGRFIENGFIVYKNGFFGLMSDDDIRQWMARLVKKTATMELRDNDIKGGWKRDNDRVCCYLDRRSGVTISDAYLVYEHLLGRNYSNKYTFGHLEEILGKAKSEAEIAMEKARRAAEAELRDKVTELQNECKAKIEQLTKQMNEELATKIAALKAEYEPKVKEIA